MEVTTRLLCQDGIFVPKQGLLFFIKFPNSDEYQAGEDEEIGEGTYIWGHYVVPQTLFSTLGEGLFFDELGVQKIVLASEILADPDTNNSNVLFKSVSTELQIGKLAIYDPDTPQTVLDKAKRVLRIS